ncbi:hypothetical protein E3U23_12615 [Erythrobacter litoralis]|uniref:hypothetical protein n=1 Tax=Erythrobacter litoralis TaxID=39960 RepID=UPI002435446A|nr:hypothetical protein [Erythrobacter litoralis]MDG6080030.1 hypothetical protein [Erythrobacter litoralis]
MKSLTILASLALASASVGALAQQAQSQSMQTGSTYADLVELAERAPLVIRAEVRDQARVKAERAPGLAPGHARLYVEAQTRSLLAGTVPVGESLRYLVDLPLTAKGKVPKLKKQEVLLFARPVAGRPGEIQLVDMGAQMRYDPALEARLRPILAELVASNTPPIITGVSEALAVEGTLVGESETQLFLDTESDGPVSVTIVRRPGQAPRWGVSWTEIVDQSASAPQRNTLAWYRLACSLPQTLPADAVLSQDDAARELAQRDYAFVIEELGPCERSPA